MLIRLLSVNIWDLPIPIPLPGFARDRRRADLLTQLPKTDADLVLIQEAFRPGFRRRIAATLDRHYSDHCIRHRRWPLGIPMDGSGGLVTFSRFRLARSRYAPAPRWAGMRLDERLGQKGCLWTEVDMDGRRLLVGNVHLYAGRGPHNARVRARQVRDLLRQLTALPRMPTVLAGDFNMALETEFTNDGPSGFELMRQAGFIEIAAGASTGLATVAPGTNPYARLLSSNLPERRLTQVFCRGEELSVARPAEITLHQPPVSDHLGLMTTLEVR